MKKTKARYMLGAACGSAMAAASGIQRAAAAGISGVEADGGTISIDVGEAGVDYGGSVADWFNSTYANLNTILNGVTGIVLIALVGVFTVKAVQVASSGGNPAQKQKALQGIMYCAIGAALVGGAKFILGLAYNLMAG